MNVELVEFYRIEHNENKGILTGTLRIKLPDIGIQILGVYACRRRNSWFFSLPGRHGVDHKTGESIRYNCIVFDDRDKQRQLISAIREQGPPFIEKRLADIENSVAMPISIEKESGSPYSEPVVAAVPLKLTTPDQPKDVALVSKRSAIISTQQVPAIKSAPKAIKKLPDYVDLPPRKQVAKGRSAYAKKR